MFTDSHCHLDRLELSGYKGDLGAAIKMAVNSGVTRMLCVGIDAEHWSQVNSIAEQYPQVCASVGIHPLDVADKPFPEDFIREAVQCKKVIAIGETGLDFHYQKENREQQISSFSHHLRLAKSLELPTIVHTREARQETIEIIQREACLESAGVLHCFTEDWNTAKSALDCNFYISFSGIVTFRNADSLREVVKRVPIDKLLIETDAPYLTPVPYRGKSNEPRYLPAVAECVAELRNLSIEKLAQITSENFERLFLSAD